MEIIKTALCGTLDSSDCMVTVRPGDTLTIDITSPVDARYHESIENTVKKVCQQNNVNKVSISVQDNGALDCVIAARTLTALQRGENHD